MPSGDRTLAELRSIIPLPMTRSLPRLYVCALACAAMATACGRTQQAETPVATPALTLARGDAAIGMPIEMSYRFVVAQNAPRMAEDEVVFVHFLDTDGELMWTDDHQPPVPTTECAPGRTSQNSRPQSVPRVPYSGETTVELGVYSQKSGVRLP